MSSVWTPDLDLPQLQLQVPCQGGRHHLRLRNGQLELCDHPDLDAELALVAFGAEEPVCVARHRLWNDALDDGGFLGEWVDETRLTEAWFSWLAMALERMRTEGFHEFLRRLPPARAQRMGQFLHHFPLPWIDRAAAMVSRRLLEPSAYSGPVACDLAEDLLAVAVSNRLRRSFVDAVGGRQLAVGAAALVPLHIATGTGTRIVTGRDTVTGRDIGIGGGSASGIGAGPVGGPGIVGRLRGPDRGVALTVDRSWLHRVWISGAAVIDGRLVLALDPLERGPDDHRRARATMVGWHRDPVGGHRPSLEVQTVTRESGSWLLSSAG